MAADVQACSMRERIALTEGCEDRVWNRLRQPPPSHLGCSEMGEGRPRRKNETPRPELIDQGVWLAILEIKAVGQPPPTSKTSMAAECSSLRAC